jgi:tetratricopeptide (TPR) repeat protein
MTDVLNRPLPPPGNWQDFERLCYDLYSRRWDADDAVLHGRQGQAQNGVDIYGHDRQGRSVGVQCKAKDQTYDGVLPEKELRAEVAKALKFKPPLDVFVIATTAPDDATILDVARSISADHTRRKLFEVRVQGWGTLRQWLSDYPELLTKYYPDLYPPSEVLSRIDLGITTTQQEHEQTRTEFARMEARITARLEQGEPNDPLQERITTAAKLTDDGSAHAAIRALQRIQREDGNNITGRNLYRLKSGFGFAHVALGELATATQDFRDAYAADPEWPNARAILAIAELLEGNSAAAFERAKEVIAADAASYHAAAVIIDTAPDTVGLAEIETLVPEGLRNRVDIAIGLSLRARKSGDAGKAEEHARAAVALGPSDLRALSTLAEVLLEPIAAIEGLLLTRRIPATSQSRFDEALDLLQRAWEELKPRDDVIRYDHIVANLLTALDIAGREPETEQILDHALRTAPQSPPLLRRYAQKMAQTGDWQAVLTAIASIPQKGKEPQDELIQAHGLLKTGSPEQALTQARALQCKFGDTRLGETAAALRLEAAAALGSLHDELDATLGTMPRSIVLRTFGVNLLKEDDPRRDALVKEIDKLVAGINNPGDRFHAAEALYAAKQYGRAAELYGDLHGTDRDDPGLRRHLMALYLADHRLEARQLFDSLAGPIKALPEYAELGAAIYERAGLLQECRTIIEQHLLTTEDLQWRLHWLSLSERLGDTKRVVDWLQEIKPDQQGRPRDLMPLAVAINRYLGDPKSLPIAYRALRGAYDDPQMHLGYTIGLFLMGRIAESHVETPDKVALDTAVVLAKKDGSKRFTRIIETEPNPRIEHDEIPPDNSLAGRLLGLRVGDEIELDTLDIEPALYVVTTIQNKYLHVHFRSLERFQSMFPESRAFGSFTIDDSKGDERFRPIFDAVKRRGEFGRAIKKQYRTGQLPLAVAARIGGGSGLEFWEAVWADPEMQFIVTPGGPHDYQKAAQLLESARRAIIDPITLFGLVRLKIAKAVRASFEDLGVVQTTIDLLRRLVHERERGRDGKHGVMGWDGEHFQMVELGPDAVEQRIAEAKEVLSFSESLTLVPAEAPGEIHDQAKHLFSDHDPAYLDTILAAWGDGRILLCDDLPFRMLAAETAPIKAIWTQPAVAFGISVGKLSTEAHFRVGNALAEAGYFFTTINSGNFLHALKESEWKMTPTLQALIDLLARPANVPQRVFVVLSDLIWGGWAMSPNPQAFVTFFSAVFVGFKKAQPGLDIDSLGNAAFARAQGIMRRNILRARLPDQLVQSTYLTPAATIIAAILEIPQSTIDLLSQLLANALHRAKAEPTENAAAARLIAAPESAEA